MRSNPTAAERALWSILRAKRLAAYKFKRQQVIAPYIVDFVCFEHRLIVEADGAQHVENTYDARRDSFLRCAGFRVLRFWNDDILDNAGGVSEAILAALVSPLPPIASQWAPPSPTGGEGCNRNSQ